MSSYNKYNDSKVYMIYSLNFDKVYIGSTRNTILHRLTQHLNKYKNGWLSSTSRIIIDHGDVRIKLIEHVNCDNIDTLLEREAHYIKLYRSENKCVNKMIPKQSKKEYYKNNIKNIRNKKYSKIQCSCDAHITKQHIARHKKSRSHYKKYFTKNILSKI